MVRVQNLIRNCGDAGWTRFFPSDKERFRRNPDRLQGKAARQMGPREIERKKISWGEEKRTELREIPSDKDRPNGVQRL